MTQDRRLLDLFVEWECSYYNGVTTVHLGKYDKICWTDLARCDTDFDWYILGLPIWGKVHVHKNKTLNFGNLKTLVKKLLCEVL